GRAPSRPPRAPPHHGARNPAQRKLLSQTPAGGGRSPAPGARNAAPRKVLSQPPGRAPAPGTTSRANQLGAGEGDLAVAHRLAQLGAAAGQLLVRLRGFLQGLGGLRQGGGALEDADEAVARLEARAAARGTAGAAACGPACIVVAAHAAALARGDRRLQAP